MDRLSGTDLLRHLSGRVFLSHHDAMRELAGGSAAPEAAPLRSAAE